VGGVGGDPVSQRGGREALAHLPQAAQQLGDAVRVVEVGVGDGITAQQHEDLRVLARHPQDVQQFGHGGRIVEGGVGGGITGHQRGGLLARARLPQAVQSASNDDGWSTTLDSLVWARLLDAEETTATQAGARTAAWRALGRLQDRQLVRRARSSRSNREVTVTLLRENGSGDEYYHPADGAPDDPVDWYFRLPVSFWTKGLDATLTMPGLAMLLTVAMEKPWSSFPAERMPEWYG
jgi:hypothetical protein